MKVTTSYCAAPIPDRSQDWCAIDNDTYCGCDECRSKQSGAIGWGATQAAAVEDLKARIAEFSNG